LPGEQLKFFQSPLNGGPPGVYPVGASPSAADAPAPFPGQDVLSTASFSVSSGGFTGTMAADDFSDFNPLPIGHIMWWGSYMNGYDPAASGFVQQFQISLYTDIPASSTSNTPFSHPGNLIATQTVSAGALSPSSGTFTEKPLPTPPGSPDGTLYQYNAELNWRQIPFPDAVNGDVEWLSIVALAQPSPAGVSGLTWGWHDRDWGISDPYAFPPGSDGAAPPYHFMDDAVNGNYFGPAAVGGYAPLDYNPNVDGISGSMDLSFALYTVPEPTTLGLLGVIAPALLMRRRRATLV